MSSTILHSLEHAPDPASRAAARGGSARAPAADEKNPALLALGERVRNLRARRGMTRKAVALAADVSERHLANLEYGIGNASFLVLQQVAAALQCPLAELIGDVTTSSPEWLLIRELLEHRDEATLRRVRVAIGELLGTGGANDKARAQPARGADRPARRRQVDARADAGRRPGLPVRRAEPRDREVRRLQHRRDPGALRHERLPALRAPRAGGGDPDLPRGGDRHARAGWCPTPPPSTCCWRTARRCGCRPTPRTTCSA